MRLDMRNALAFVFDVDLTSSSACQACKDTLYAYVDAEFDGGEAGAKFPDVKAHLDKCVLCQRSYNDLKAVLKVERESQVTPPEPDLDFSYLAPLIRKNELWEVIIKGNRRVARLFGKLGVLVRQNVASFEQFPSGALLPAWNLRSTDNKVSLVTLPDEEENVKITVSVTAVSDDRGSLTVRVETIDPPPLFVRRAKVILERQGVMVQGAYTNVNGRVEFSKISLGDYLVIVKHKKREWKMAISLVV